MASGDHHQTANYITLGLLLDTLALTWIIGYTNHKFENIVASLKRQAHLTIHAPSHQTSIWPRVEGIFCLAALIFISIKEFSFPSYKIEIIAHKTSKDASPIKNGVDDDEDWCTRGLFMTSFLYGLARLYQGSAANSGVVMSWFVRSCLLATFLNELYLFRKFLFYTNDRIEVRMHNVLVIIIVLSAAAILMDMLKDISVRFATFRIVGKLPWLRCILLLLQGNWMVQIGCTFYVDILNNGSLFDLIFSLICQTSFAAFLICLMYFTGKALVFDSPNTKDIQKDLPSDECTEACIDCLTAVFSNAGPYSYHY